MKQTALEIERIEKRPFIIIKREAWAKLKHLILRQNKTMKVLIGEILEERVEKLKE